MATINDVAKKAGVSKTTVSRYLNQQFDSMTAETKQRVAAAIAELEYTPNMVARGLKVKGMQTIGVIVANVLNPYSTEITRGIEDYCISKGFNMVLCNADDRPEKQQDYIRMLHAKQIDGFIIQPADGSIGGLIDLWQKEIPLVLIDRSLPELEVDTVLVDNRKGMSEAVTYLHSLGHQKIALLTPPPKKISSRQERIEGFLEAFSSNQGESNDAYLEIYDPGPEGLYRAIKGLHEKKDPPTALITINGRVTLETLVVLKDLNLQIPYDFSLLGFDNPEWAQIVEPPLTTIEQPTYQMGVAAAELILRQITKERRGRSKQKRIELDTKLVVRESCQPPSN